MPAKNPARPQSVIAAPLPVYHGGLSSWGNRRIKAKLSSNENPFGAPPLARRAYRAAAQSLARYPADGAPDLCRALAQRHKLEAKNILTAAGSDEILRLLAHAFLAPGDNALVSAHGFALYRALILGQNARAVIAAEKNWRADGQALAQAADKKTKLVFLANPNNPTSTYLSAAHLLRLRRALPSHALLVLDSAYAEYAEGLDEYQDGAKLARQFDNVVMVRTFSKAYGLAGLRLGWAYAAPEIIKACQQIRLPFSVSAPAEAAGIAALADAGWQRRVLVHNHQWRSWLADALRALGIEVPPPAGNFLMLNFKSAALAQNAWRRLAEEGYILRQLAPDYDLPHCLRLTIGRPAANRHIVRVLAKLMAQSRRSR